MVQPGAKVEQLADGMKFTEGPVWLPKEQKLVFSDIPNSVLMQWSQKAGLSEFRKSENANGNILDLDGNIISCQHGTRNIIRIDDNGKSSVLVDKFNGKRFNSPNDVAVWKDGTLWFDTRQGRLFIAIDGNYWQTNGADGLAHVSDTVPTNPPVIGSTWFDTENEVLYVYVGKDDDGRGLWQVVKGAGELTATTATLPLSIAKSTFSLYQPTIIPEVPIDQMGVQKDFNEYIFASLVALDKSLTESTVTISETPPTENVVNGTLWYDSSTLELSVWYEDDDSAQWVPTSVNYTYDDDLADIRSSVVAETTAREYAVSQLLSEISDLRQGGIPDVDALETKVAEGARLVL